MTHTALLFTMVIGGILLLSYLVIALHLHPFIAMLISAAFVGVGTGMKVDAVFESMQRGMGGTLGFVATIIGLGAMFGQFLEESGGVDRLAQSMTHRFGEKNSQWALTLTGFLVAIPVFFEVGLIILIPLIYGMAKHSGKSLLYYGIPLAAGLAVTHAFVPPTPGPVAVASMLDADLGLVVVYGIAIGLPTACVAGPLYALVAAKKFHIPVPEHIMNLPPVKDRDLPATGLIIALVLAPLGLILTASVAKFVMAEGLAKEIITFIGHPFIALTLASLAAFKTLGHDRGLSSEQVRTIASKALEPAALVILVTGAGGMFKQVLIDSGAGPAFGELVAASPLPPLLAAFIVALAVRAIQGSATVAMLTAAGLMSPLARELGLSPSMLALMVITIAAGATAMSHVNDTGFWIVNRYFGLSVRETLIVWTNMENVIGLTGLILALITASLVA